MNVKVFCKDCKWYCSVGVFSCRFGGITKTTICDSPKNIKIDYETGEKKNRYKRIDEINKDGNCLFYTKGIPRDTFEEDEKRIYGFLGLQKKNREDVKEEFKKHWWQFWK